ncbi:hypothetical protein SLA2020_490260 [Shorea laevis]|uniref:Uncharacterized protein n=1 Tax=Rubroshorea leprosula TaxID=152421 RepID=A0AAV5MPY5_9ROSI|nr:hypothetical protein SLEP1_g58596 [Rubroshorea leprosula]GKV52248.1 hypothetical protein SLEP1_g58837 [Rubroshorea leprosula]
MVSIALLLFRPNPDFVLLLPVVEPGRLDSFPCPPALLLSGSGFFASFQSSWSTRKKEMNECSFGKMYNNTPTETKAKGESRRWTYRTEIRSQIDILIH